MAKLEVKGTTLVNGLPANWTPEIEAEFTARVGPLMSADEVVTRANYFTPRPYVDEYNRGDDRHGFTYTLNNRHVCQLHWRAP